jgi:hypothetical protein
MSGKHKSTSSNAIPVKNWRRTISIKDKLDVTSRLEKGGHVANICHNIRLVHSSVSMIYDNAEKINKELG